MMISADSVDYIRKIVRERSAIVLEESKQYLIESRLDLLARQEGINSLDELVRRIRDNPSSSLADKAVDAMTTNETSFFRDHHPFELIKTQLVPEMLKRVGGAKTLNIWCAACSSGQEPYSIAMLLHDQYPQVAKDWRIRILASDISNTMLEKAKSGLYSQLEINRGLPASYIAKFFARDGSMNWRLNEQVRRLVEFRKINLVADWPMLPKMDLILIRNVLIYFNVETKRRVLERMHEALAESGRLMLGGVETTINMGLERYYEREQLGKSIVYRRV